MTTGLYRKGMVLGIVLLMIGTVFSGLVNTVRADDEKLIISVTDTSPWFSKGSNSGHPEYWQSYTHDDHSYIWTYVGGMSEEPSQPDCWAEFRPYLTQDGEYDVYACFYADPQNSNQVPHTVYYDGGSITIPVNQYAPDYFTWMEMKLGTWNFKAGADTCVQVTDATGETYDGYTTLNADTIEFVKTGGDNAPPTVDSLSISPSSITLGDYFTISYSVSDDVGLDWVELWRTNDDNGQPDGNGWIQIGPQYQISGTSYSRSFTDSPSSTGSYWYGIHVGDNAGNWGPGDSPINVEVTPPPIQPPGSLTLTGSPECDGANPYNHLSWTPSSGATSYDVYRDGTFYYDLATLGTTFDNTIVTPGTTYQYFIRASNPEGSADSNSFSVTTNSNCENIGSEYIQGIDVSKYQGTIDWNQVYAVDIRFAFVKATAGDAQPPQLIDPNFVTNMNGAYNAGVLAGAYHYAYPQHNTAEDEAQFFVDIAGDYITNGYLRPVLDLEEGGGLLTPQALSNWVHTWMDTVEGLTGIEPLLYVNSNYATNYLDNTVTQYDLWIAHWTCDYQVTPNIGLWGDWSFWQYYGLGTPPLYSNGCGFNIVAGVEDPDNVGVDLDVFNGNQEQLNAFVIGGDGQANPMITSSLTILQSPPYYVGDTLNAQYTIQNQGTASITFDILTVGGRDPDDQVADFTHINDITLAPGESHSYQGSLIVSSNSHYDFFSPYES